MDVDVLKKQLTEGLMLSSELTAPEFEAVYGMSRERWEELETAARPPESYSKRRFDTARSG